MREETANIIDIKAIKVDGHPNPEAFGNGVGETKADLTAFGEGQRSLPTLPDFDQYRIWDTDPIEEPNHKIHFGEVPFATDGDTCGIAAPEKSGKTGLMGAIISGCVNDTGHVYGMEEIMVQPNTERKAVIHVDTEQSKSAQYRNHLSILRRGGLTSSPDHYYAYNVRAMDYTEYQSFTETILELAAAKHGGVYAAIIDGIADFVNSVNDDVQAREILAFFARLAEKYNCPIILVVHVNPNSTKERGHVGSEMRRKVGALIGIEEYDGNPTIVPRLLRYGRKETFPHIQMQWCDERKYHVSTGTYEKQPKLAPAERRLAERLELARKIFPVEDTKLEYGQLIEKIMDFEAVSERTAKDRKKDMGRYEYLYQDVEGFWRRNMFLTED